MKKPFGSIAALLAPLLLAASFGAHAVQTAGFVPPGQENKTTPAAAAAAEAAKKAAAQDAAVADRKSERGASEADRTTIKELANKR